MAYKYAVPSDGAQRCMLLIVGEPFTGKSTSAATFPEPLFIDLDHKAPPKVDTLPFWNADFCEKWKKRTNPNEQPNKRDAILNFLSREVAGLPPTATLILDSLTMLSAAFHHQTEKVDGLPINPNTKKVDGFFLWKEKINYFNGIMELLKVHKGHVIVIAHEQKKRDEDGDMTEVIKPVLTGAFCDLIASHFTLVFRQFLRRKNGIDEYLWDVKPTPLFRSNNTLGIKESPIPAHFNSIKPYLDNPQPTELKFDMVQPGPPKGEVKLT